MENDLELFCPASRQEWRFWLQQNHGLKQSVWLVQYKQASGIPTISWSEAVDEALCFGWVDSRKKPIDDEKFMQFFSRRKITSTWSKINKEKIEQLINQGLMVQAGYQSIEVAKRNGSWAILDDVEELTIPEDLEIAFENQPGSKAFFLSLSKSVKKAILQWVVLAKRAETRQKRIAEIAELAAQGLRPVQFR
jgi:uncharacterized protein YdeI (YjbR/CyaY-like superfamily)